LHKALGAHRVTAIHIDNGFMRYGESEQVVKSLNALTPPLDVHCKTENILQKISWEFEEFYFSLKKINTQSFFFLEMLLEIL
jgi:GMP synthase PP-ATPase subunit